MLNLLLQVLYWAIGQIFNTVKGKILNKRPSHLVALIRKNRLNNSKILHFVSKYLCDGCGSVGRVVASDTSGPRFDSSQRQTLQLSNALNRRK